MELIMYDELAKILTALCAFGFFIPLIFVISIKDKKSLLRDACLFIMFIVAIIFICLSSMGMLKFK
ncbi:hypothetical protein PROVALCAL_02572 [Providencia alcalifaciens DSM 30120]|uniref:Uncharacterized protein n=1 Tax=Providencia alcalifaciens DSM 30120 TaxID=520999 RepID=B6XGT6_9GAMM|nr:hypothetical protein PROVALCAL_02572 [Providencia alcalifaciens DSM 30120]